MISAVIGGLVGACVTLYWNFKRENRKIKCTLKALNEETNELFKIVSDIRNGIKNTNEAKNHNYFLKSSSNYFSTYEVNSNIIGAINDELYRNSIIRHYLLSKRFFDALLTNTFYLEKFLENEASYENSKNTYFKEKANIFDDIMRDETKHLKSLVSEIEENLSSYNENHKKFIEDFDKNKILIFLKTLCPKK